MRLTVCLVICLAQILSYCKAHNGKYTVIAPGTIHSNENYTVAVAVHHTDQPCTIKVGIIGPSYNESQQVEVSQNELKQVEFNLPMLEEGDYSLTARGVNCLDNFKNITILNFAEFDNIVKIQTDKGQYQPGDEINYRVLFLDKDLKPAEPEENAVIWFEDGKRNRIKEIKDFKTINGVYTGKFKISEFSNTGHWVIGVDNVDEADGFTNFKVNKYVFPKFAVKVEPTEKVSVKDGNLQVVARANYIYGKPLDGKATVVVRMYYGSSIEHEGPPTLIKTADMVRGKAKVDFNIKEYKAYLNYPSYLSIVATVEEQFTGVKINGSADSYIYPYRYSMNCVSYNTCWSFVADKEADVIFHITHVDGTNLHDTKSNVELIYKEVLTKNDFSFLDSVNVRDEGDTSTISENRTFSFKAHMNETGFVSFKVSLPELAEYKEFAHYYSMQLKYLDEQREVEHIVFEHKKPEKAKAPAEEPKEYFTLSDGYNYYNKKLQLNKADQFTINSSQPISYFDYNVIGRGNILKSGRVDLPDKPKVYNLTLTPEFLWAPDFALYVYYVGEKGEYHYAERVYFMDFELPNQINITASEQVKPGEVVTLKIQTTPNSFVGLMAVDQSVLLMQNNNDLNAYQLQWAVASYSTSTPYQGGYSEYPGTTSGCVTLTNADYFYNWTEPDYIHLRSMKFSSYAAGMDTSLRGGTKQYMSHQQSNNVLKTQPAVSANNIKVRQDFAETWLFDNIENTEAAEFKWSKKIPDTITSWVLTAFSLNPTKGLGITRKQTKIKTFLPFFISVRLPYSVKRGEIINVPALVFNYLEKALDVEVTLDNSDDEYEFTEFDNEIISEQKRSKSIQVPANGAAGVSFLLKPKVIGNVMLKFTAVSAVAGDAIRKSMKVEPEGSTQYANRAYFVNLKEKREVKSSFDLELPADVVPDSEHVEVGVMGDILGPVLNNLDNLIRLPRGCGEQTMSTLLPNYLVMKYLKNSQRLTSTIETKLRFNLEAGYQNMLRYRHRDGSFSSFGPSEATENPRNGSTWLTAYVVRSLLQIKEFVNVNEKIIEGGLEYLSKQQVKNGTFTEKGDYFYASQRNHITLTGAALLAISENGFYADKYSNALNKGLEFIAQNIDKSDSLHAQAVGTYTLNRAKHAAAKDKISKLKSLAKTESDRIWWSADKYQSSLRWWYYVFGNDVEITSYALLTLLDQEATKVNDVLPIITWLVAQRNSYGGFASTQDTVLGLTALIKFSEFADYEPAKMDVNIESKASNETIKLTKDNGGLYQTVEMPKKSKSITFSARGSGSALVQIAYQYNVFEKYPKPSFTVKTRRLDDKSLVAHLEMSVCVNYVGEGLSTNMALLEISSPSGYIFDDETLQGIKDFKRVSNTELKNSDSLLVVYFDHLFKNDETCLTIELLRAHAVANQKPASIVLYDYYDTNKKTTAYYEVSFNLCDICQTEEECNKCKLRFSST